MTLLNNRLATVQAVMDRLGITRARAYELTRNGEFSDFLVVIGERQYRYRPDGLEEYILRGGKVRAEDLATV